MTLPEQQGDFFDSDTSHVLAMLRWPLAMCIVAVHWFANTDSALDTLRPDAVWPVAASVAKAVRVFLSDNGVGSFFFISGFLFFAGGSMNRSRYVGKLRKRINTLLIPYLLWNIIFVVWLWSHQLPLMRDIFPGSAHYSFDWGSFISGLMFTPVPHNANLWFIRELMICVLLVPLLLPLIRRWPVALLCASGAAFMTCYLNEWDYLTGLSQSVLFFSAGAILGTRRCDLVALANGKRWYALASFLMLGIAYWILIDVTRWSFILKLASIICLLLFAIDTFAIAVRNGHRANTFLTSATFFVFAAHPFILTHCASGLFKLFNPQSDIAYTVITVAGYLLLLGILLGLYRLCGLLSPTLLGILTGRRNRQPAVSVTN